jgi:serine/threonine-protein kinase
MTDFLTRYTNEPLDGKYRLIERLGAGGMGEVFKAEHVYLGATRVIKIVRPQISASTEAHERFVREARLATKVHHHNVATLHDFASLPDGAAYMVWEFIDGENLSQLLRRRGQLAPRLAIRLATEALSGLDAIHRAGIVHRDISPENLMIARDDDGEEHVKIIDLGVAKADEGDPGMTATGMFIGKLRYASPEHLGFLPEGERIDGRADLYSMAIVLYEMLTGRAPFEATSPHQYYVRYSRDEALTMPDLATVPGGPELQSVLSRALERDRNRRFANAREFSEALQRASAAIPDERSLPTMALAPDADDTMKMGTQSPFATTVRTDHGVAAPPTLLTPLPESAVYTPPPPPLPAPAPVVAAPVPGRSKFLPIALAISVLLIVAFVGLVADDHDDDASRSHPADGDNRAGAPGVTDDGRGHDDDLRSADVGCTRDRPDDHNDGPCCRKTEAEAATEAGRAAADGDDGNGRSRGSRTCTRARAIGLNPRVPGRERRLAMEQRGDRVRPQTARGRENGGGARERVRRSGAG